ncbi:MFS transporter [Amycolatopsis sp. PS_44_ISF1]|uniref:MFS transporter n=1 Tax=Amycolatopsis sp. PS_44_ISF1 TaxID=2974917 RepID=UPI0028DD895E|nr:MFS transporter [Amycolatopsis sp. PS_44_ISF1]MDT8913026.1 MFS transporter [Amycolatopsis sp. PS_44_ISF1]
MTLVPLSRNRNYTLLWGSQALSVAGFSASVIALPLLVLAVTGSPAVSGLVLGVDAMAQLVAGLPAGALADRWNRKKIMLGCEAAQAVAVGSLAAAVWWDAVSTAHVVVVAAVMGVCRSLFGPAEGATVARIVPQAQLPTAVAMNSARGAVGQLAGTAVGGFLYALGRAVPFAFNVATHLISFVALLFLRAPHHRAEVPSGGHLGREMAEGLRWVWRERHVRVTVLCAVSLNFFFSAYYIVIVVLAKDRGVPSGEIGVMAAMLGVGGVAGSLAAPYLQRRISPYVSIMGVFWVLTALTPLAVFITGDGYLMGALFVAMSLLPPTANTTIGTYQLLLTPDRLRGRLTSVMGVIGGVSAATGPAFGGLLVQAVPGPGAVVLCTAGIAAITLVVTFSPTLRRFPRSEDIVLERPEAAPAGRPSPAPADPRRDEKRGNPT